ncbi:MAG: SBBP repeat-containing protein [Blastocatellia bacterium]|nr:SBBP repeat-containing protein [Blastocatellia bacterium]
MAVDSDGSAYVTGRTTSLTFQRFTPLTRHQGFSRPS